MNSILARVSCRISDLYLDLRDGRMLIKLLEVLSGERLVSVTCLICNSVKPWFVHTTAQALIVIYWSHSINIFDSASFSTIQPKPTKGRMRIHCLENVDKALQFLKEQRVHLENMGSHDIVDGNHRLILGLIWTIILRFQVSQLFFYTFLTTLLILCLLSVI